MGKIEGELEPSKEAKDLGDIAQCNSAYNNHFYINLIIYGMFQSQLCGLIDNLEVRMVVVNMMKGFPLSTTTKTIKTKLMNFVQLSNVTFLQKTFLDVEIERFHDVGERTQFWMQSK